MNETNTEQQENQEQERKEQLENRFFQHFQDLRRQEARLKGEFPGFDLSQELKDPMFFRLTSPGVGLGVEEAFYALHHRQLLHAAMEAAVKEAIRQVTGSLASLARRPRENGISAQAPTVSHFDYRNATKQQREALKRQIRQAAAEGKKVYPRM